MNQTSALAYNRIGDAVSSIPEFLKDAFSKFLEAVKGAAGDFNWAKLEGFVVAHVANPVAIPSLVLTELASHAADYVANPVEAFAVAALAQMGMAFFKLPPVYAAH